MRNENYFKIKLETSKETLTMAESKLGHLDLQLIKLKERFDHDKKVYEDQIVHMQNTVSEMNKRIPNLEKKLTEGYTHFDNRTGKAYKSFEAIHEGQLKDAMEEARENLKAAEERQKLKVELRNKRKLKPEERQIVEAELIRESMQSKDEIARIQQQEKENLAEKLKFYEDQLTQLKSQQKEEKKQVVNEELIQEGQIAIVKDHKKDVDEQLAELESGKVQCPECGKLFTKGGAFAAHYKSHFNGNDNEGE